LLLRLGDDLQRERGLTRRLGAVDLDHPPARQAAHAEREVQPQGARGDHLHVARGDGVAQAHDRPFAELLLDLTQCGCERFLAVVVHAASRDEWSGKSRPGPGELASDYSTERWGPAA